MRQDEQQQTNTAGMTVDPPRAGRREWLGLAVIALPCLLYAMDLTVLFLAIPAITRDLQPSSAELLWITDIYGFLLAGSLITMGRLGDRVGRRRLLLIGAGAFGAISVLAAFSTSPGMLIASRALLGIAGATLAPSTLSLISNMFQDPGQRKIAIGVWVTSFSLGSAIGPVVGGAFLAFFWWGSVFLLAVPVMGLLLVLGPRMLPEFRDPDPGRFDVLSAALSLVAVLAVVFGVKHAVVDGLGSVAVTAIVAGVLVGVVFARRQQTLEDPLIDVRLFRVPAFSVSVAANTLSIFLVGGAFLFIAQYMQLVLAMTPLQAGLWTLPSASAFIVGSMLAPLLVHRVSPARVVSAGLTLAAAGLALLTQIEGASGLTLVVIGSIATDLGVAIVVVLSTDLIVGSVAPEHAGAAAGISETGTELGGALGVALLGSLGTAIYRSDIAGAVPADVPAHAAAAARDTLGGALAAADQLPAGLLDTATAAFTHGLQLAAGASAMLALATAVLTAALLREPATPPADRDEPADVCAERILGPGQLVVQEV
jgi:DHA2 family multidrug resistance protein-like MFS transporter